MENRWQYPYFSHSWILRGFSCAWHHGDTGFLQHSVSFIRDIRAKFGISNSTQSLSIELNSDDGISDFQISGQSLIKKMS